MYYSNIVPYDVANGEGIRVTLFVSGCKFHCKNCFNSQAWDFSYGKEYTRETEQEILKKVSEPIIDGLTLLGGDPLWQSLEDIDKLSSLCREVRRKGKNVWIWSGFIWEEIFRKPISVSEAYIINAQQDLIIESDVFVDGQFVEKLKDLSLPWRGSLNQRVIDVQKSLKEKRIVLHCN